jgi:hypothetical protein
LTQFPIEQHPVGAFVAKKLKLIALHFDKRISAGNFLLYFTQRIICTEQGRLSEHKERDAKNQQ